MTEPQPSTAVAAAPSNKGVGRGGVAVPEGKDPRLTLIQLKPRKGESQRECYVMISTVSE